MATEIDAARLLTYQAGWNLNQGRGVTKLSSMAKLYASEAAVRAATEAALPPLDPLPRHRPRRWLPLSVSQPMAAPKPLCVVQR